MADNKLSVRRVEGVVDGTVAATLSQLLRLTSDAVIVFNMEGMVLLANEEAESLFAKEDGTIAGLDVRFLFTPANQENLQKPFFVESLPFAIDGSTSMVAAPTQDGTSQVKEHIERIVMMGGALTRGNLGVMSEFNVGVDPEAAKIVFASGVHVAMVGLEVGDAARVMPEDIENIQNSGKSGDMLVKLLLNYRVHYQEEGFSMYDPTAVAYLLAPQMFETKDVFVDVECAGGLTAGCTVVDLAGYLGEKPNATVCVGVDQKAFRTWFVHQIQKCNVLDGSAPAVEGVLLD